MGRGSSKAGGGSSGTQPAVRNTTNIPTNAVPLTSADAQDMRDQQDSMYDANTTAAVKMYISNTDFDKQNHSMSQTMNYLLDDGVDFNSMTPNQINKKYGLRLTANDIASMQYTDSYMEIATHPIGKSIQLQRGAHDDVLKQLGISDYTKMSQSQLQSALVGQTFQNKSYMSTSYDVTKNPFLSSSSGVSGGREVVYNIKAGPNTQMLFGAKKQTEVIIGKGTNFKITGVKYTGKSATPGGMSVKPQIQVDIETY